MEHEFKEGDIVRHFKRELVSKDTTQYLYQIKGIAIHSETKEKMMVYQGLYDTFSLYVRPLVMFLSEVDRKKYPSIRQKYRFEKTTLTDEERENILRQAKNLGKKINL